MDSDKCIYSNTYAKEHLHLNMARFSYVNKPSIIKRC